MFADALKSAAGSFDALFYVSANVDTSAENTRRIEQSLCERWDTEVKITLSGRSEIPVVASAWDRFLHPAMDFHRIPDYLEMSGKKQIQALESCLEADPPFILVQRLRCMCPLLLTRMSLPPVFFDMDDIEHVAFRRSIAMPPFWKSKWLLNLQTPALKSGEKKAMRLAKKTFVCSASDKSILAGLVGPEKIEVIPNAVRIPQNTSLPESRSLLILGQYGYMPNRIGVEYFIEKVWPHVLSAISDAELVVAGPGSESIRQFHNPPPRIRFTGFVDDLDALYDSIRVVVCPVLSGGGTRVKLIEAAAHAKPIVSTTIGAEGLELIDEKHALLRDAPASMAEACVKLLKDDVLSKQLAEAARKIAQESYERSSVSKKIARIFSTYPS